MPKCWVFSGVNGRANIITLGPPRRDWAGTLAEWEAYALAKTRFELTRPKNAQGRIIDPNEHFNATNPAHIARENSLLVTELTDADLPVDRSKHKDWVLQGNRVIVSPVPLP